MDEKRVVGPELPAQEGNDVVLVKAGDPVLQAETLTRPVDRARRETMRILKISARLSPNGELVLPRHDGGGERALRCARLGDVAPSHCTRPRNVARPRD